MPVSDGWNLSAVSEAGACFLLRAEPGGSVSAGRTSAVPGVTCKRKAELLLLGKEWWKIGKRMPED